MNRIIFLVVGLFIGSVAFSQNVEFTKKAFPNTKEELNFALKAIKHGDELYNEALYYYEHEDFSHFKNALPYYQKAQKFNPDNAELNYKIGTCILYTLHNERSLSYFKKAYKLDAQVADDIHYYLGRANHYNEYWDKAIASYTTYKSQIPTLKSIKPYEKEGKLKDVTKKIEECKNGLKFSAKPINVVIQNVGKPINTEYPEYGVVISADESIMYFTSRRPGSTGFESSYKEGHEANYPEDIYVSTHNEDGTWSIPKQLDHPINGFKHDATVALSPDAQTLLVYKADAHQGGIYHCDLDGDTWGHPMKLKHIDTDAHESSACYSPDQQTLFFVSNTTKDSKGGKDIYYSTWDKTNEEWSEPRNIGASINTEYDEEAVFMHADGKTLYFSSQGHSSMGGHDVFRTVFIDSVWTTPVNLGFPVNGSEDDVFLVMAANAHHAYYATHHPDSYGDKDIYKIVFLGAEKDLVSTLQDPLLAGIGKPVSMHIPDPSAPLLTSETTILKGVIKDKSTNLAVSARIEITNNKTHEIVAVYKSNSKTGKYLVTLPSGSNYGITVIAEDYLFHSENVDIPDYATYSEVFKEIDLSKIDIGASIVLKNIFFDSRVAVIKKESVPELARLVALMKENPTLKIEISGHTDNIGSLEYNQKLSDDRAKSVVNYLVGEGIDTSRLISVGYGFAKPIASNSTSQGRQLNRRTEFKIVSK
jgi:outer membrane protein OmpA-like peptidoglycan-associated protein/tetratricopeptide (TPR) repeat protein